MIKVTSNLSLCSRMFHWQWQWQFIDSDNVVLDYYYVQCSVEINVINYMLWCLNYISSRLVFETWVLVLCPRGVSPSLITILPRDRQCCSTWWLTKWLLLAQCFTVSDFITFVLAAYACRLLVAQWYETRGIVDTGDTCAVSRYFLLLRYTAIYRNFGDTGIVT